MNVLAALLLVLSYPPFNLWWLAWVAGVPFFVGLSKTVSPRQAFTRGYIFGLLFWAGSIYWVGDVTVFGALMLILYLSLYPGLFGWVFYWFIKREIKGLRFLLLISTSWVVLEWLRSHLFTGFGWSLLAYSQAPNLPVIQICDLVGALGVSFVVVWVNGAVFLVASYSFLLSPQWGERTQVRGGIKQILTLTPALSLKGRGGELSYTLLLILVVLIYGFYRLNEKVPTTPISIAVIQGNVPQEIKWEDQYREVLFERYELLTKTAALDHPGLIIWPETSIVEDFRDPEIQNRIAGIAKEANSFLLVGAPWSSQTQESGKRKVESGEETDGHYYNSAILFDLQGNLVQKYDKLHLVPYGEFIPFEKQFPFQRNWIVTGDFIGGKEHTVFNIPSSQLPSPPKADPPLQPEADQPLAEAGTLLRAGLVPSEIGFSVLVCFEDVFPDLVRQFVKKGARLLINISNDAWFHESGAPFQHAQTSVFRAVENRVPVVRATNTGFSCFIDSRGRIYEKVPPFKTGYLTAKVEVPVGIR